MSEIRWTDEQETVLRLRDKSILVSAAAGSGKTAVLVERILRHIMDEEHPVDLDRLLVVTFTRAAAAQMKERIREALFAKLKVDPGNPRLQRQEMLLATANITTIDSFCLQVVREHVQELPIDPGFRVVDEKELELLSREVIEDLLEDCYEAQDPKFLAFIDAYADMRNDDVASDMILKLVRAANAQPWPEKWLLKSLKSFEINSLEELAQTDWMQAGLSQVKRGLSGMYSLAALAKEIAEEADGPEMYLPLLTEECDAIEAMCQMDDYAQIGEALAHFVSSLGRLSTKRGTNEEKKEEAKALRNQYKDRAKEILARYYAQELPDVLVDLQEMRAPMEGLIALTLQYLERFAEAKR
ncbi:MAG: UvrD-helicase domain-containing protein [Lachnospiraceae bacterium]|nr:UvrD-helicase domain-containing protein [Lachnospiraceae bacterium]